MFNKIGIILLYVGFNTVKHDILTCLNIITKKIIS